MKFHLLIVEDDRNIRDGLCDALELEGYTVTPAANGGDALREFNLRQPDLILLDVMMPGLNGYEVCRQIRRSDLTVPIIMLTAKSEEIDKVLGLELGADDYVTKPFSLRELAARIAARLRLRATLPVSDATTATEFPFGPWKILPDQLRAVRDGETVELTRRELELLSLFAAHPNEVLDRERIMRTIWGQNAPSSRTLDQHLVVLRRKIYGSGETPLLETVYGVGYRYRYP